MKDATGSTGHAADRVAAAEDTATFLRQERAEQQVRLARLADDMARLIAASEGSNADDEHDPEGQTIAYERSQLSAVISQAQEHLTELDAALGRLAAGTYGTCEVCGRQIDRARLEARPTARACIQHVGDRRRRS